MDTYTSEMDDALACVDALIPKIPPEDTAPPLVRDENAPPVVETGKAARRRGGGLVYTVCTTSGVERMANVIRKMYEKPLKP